MTMFTTKTLSDFGEHTTSSFFPWYNEMTVISWTWFTHFSKKFQNYFIYFFFLSMKHDETCRVGDKLRFKIDKSRYQDIKEKKMFKKSNWLQYFDIIYS